jgi:isocitrate/isopropylmalate dehydrogenase
LFEPSGGSAPDIAGKDIANPIAMDPCLRQRFISGAGRNIGGGGVT